MHSFFLNKALLSLYLFAFAVFVPAIAGAQDARGYSGNNEIYACGPVTTYDLKTEGDHFGVCDFYSRQLEYRPEAQKFRRQLHERQENFATLRRIALEDYKDNLQDLYEAERKAEQN